MKIALAQLNYHIGNFEFNVNKIIQSLREARSNGASLVIFSELCLTGYPPRDFLEYPGFIKKCEEGLARILPETDGIDCILGTPWKNHGQGKSLFNAALHLSNGEVQNHIYKALLPTYDIFDEYRYFEPESDLHCIEIQGHRVALTICEDLWNIENQQYKFTPMETLILEKPELMINIAASPFHYRQEENRIEVLRANTLEYGIPLLYVNHVGAQTELIFDGGSLALNARGELINSPRYFEEVISYIDWSQLVDAPSIGSLNDDTAGLYPRKEQRGLETGYRFTWSKFQSSGDGLDSTERSGNILNQFANPVYLHKIHQAILLGIRDFFKKSNFTRAVIGLSGGIDSALVTVLAAEALGPENILAVLMPSRYSSSHSLSDSYKLVENLGISHIEIPIENITDSFDRSLSPLFKDLPFSIAEENIQSRSRAVLLMAISNKLGYVLLNTSNKSECAVGYGTLYGDMCGALSVIGDLYKMQIFALCRYLNTLNNQIPEAIIEKAPSAELRPDQKDSDSLPEYAELDPILFSYIEENKDYQILMEEGFSEVLVQKTLGLVNQAEFKRYQSAPILRISPKAFGMGRRLPIVGKYDF